MASHLVAKGYSILSLSYPIATKGGMIEGAYPDFTATAWAEQIASISQDTIAENGLTDEVVMLAWSMGGKAVQPAYEAFGREGLDVAAVVSLAATPGLPGLIAYTTEYKMAPTGYATRPEAYDGWLKQLAEMGVSGDGGEVIPQDAYLADYVGDIPVGLQGYGQVYRNGKFELDHLSQALDYGAFSFSDYPFVVVLEGNSQLDARHSLLDRSYWTLYNANTVMSRLQSSLKEKPGALPAEDWEKLNNLVHQLSDRLSISVPGNHFFFVGKDGAARTADAIVEAIDRTTKLEAEVAELVPGRAE